MVVLWSVDGEKCGKCGLLMVVFLGGGNRHFLEVFWGGVGRCRGRSPAGD